MSVHTSDEYKLEAMWPVLQPAPDRAQGALKNLKRGDVEKASGNTVRQDIDDHAVDRSGHGPQNRQVPQGREVQEGTDPIQGDEVRVSAPSRDELQAVIQDLKAEDWGIELKFGNYR